MATWREGTLHSLYGNNILVPLYLWWRETIPKSKKVSKWFVHNYPKILVLLVTLLKMHGNSKNEQRPVPNICLKLSAKLLFLNYIKLKCLSVIRYFEYPIEYFLQVFTYRCMEWIIPPLIPLPLACPYLLTMLIVDLHGLCRNKQDQHPKFQSISSIKISNKSANNRVSIWTYTLWYSTEFLILQVFLIFFTCWWFNSAIPSTSSSL